MSSETHGTYAMCNTSILVFDIWATCVPMSSTHKKTINVKNVSKNKTVQMCPDMCQGNYVLHVLMAFIIKPRVYFLFEPHQINTFNLSRRVSIPCYRLCCLIVQNIYISLFIYIYIGNGRLWDPFRESFWATSGSCMLVINTTLYPRFWGRGRILWHK